MDQVQLTALLGQELKSPLFAIAQLSELSAGPHDPHIQALVAKALNTIESIAVHKRFSSGQTALKLEPIHVGSVAFDVAQSLSAQMRSVDCALSFDFGASLQPVAVDRELFEAALTSMWQTVLNCAHGPTQLTCLARNTRSGSVRISVVGDNVTLDQLQLSKQNLASAQAVADIAGSGIDFIIAQQMFDLVNSAMTQARYKQARGVGVTLPISKQMALV